MDLPDYFLPPDVDSLVRHALKARTVPGADILPLGIKRLEWSMGSPMSPSWQVAGKGVGCLESNILSFSLGNGVGMAMVHSWKEYSTARAAWRAKRQAAKPPPLPPGPPKVGLPPDMQRLEEMDLDADGVRGKRTRPDE